MDMLPPQAPPAVSQGREQEAVAAIGRLVDTQAWLAEQEAQLPPFPERSASSGRDMFLQELLAYWNASVAPSPGAAHVPRAMAFAQRIVSTMRDEATLRRLDGTLSESAAALAIAFAKSDGSTLRPGLHVYELMFGQVPYAGAVVLTDDDEPDLALLFMPDRGWEEFTDRHGLHRATEERVRLDLARGIIPWGIMADELHGALDAPFVGSRKLDGDVFGTLAKRVIDLQQDRVAAAWESFPAAPDDDNASRYLVDRVAPYLRLHPSSDVHAILGERNVRLVELLNEERLQRVPGDVAQAWREARSDYATTIRVAERQRTESGLREIMPLDAFVHAALKARLLGLGIQVDPDDVMIDVHDFTRSYFYNPTGRVDASYLGRPRMRLTLAQAAMRNSGFLDDDIFIAKHSDEKAPPVALPSGVIKTLMRDADLASAYRDYLVEALDTSAEGRLARALAGDVRKARIRFEAEDARLSYFLPDEPRGFRADHEFRGYEFVKAVLDAPAASKRRRVGGHEVVVRQLLYKGMPLDDVLVIGTRSGLSVAREILYTPDAPDGVAFREFSNRRDVATQFLSNPAFETYLLDRLPAEFARTTPNGAERHFDVSEGERLFRWVFNLGGDGKTRASEPFGDRIVEGDVIEAAYDTGLSLLLGNLLAVARPTAHADIDNLPLVVDAEAMGRGIARLIGRPFQAGWRAYDGIKEGDVARAFVDITEAYVTSLDFLAFGSIKPLLAQSIAVRAGMGSRQLVRAGKKLREPASLFDDRFIAHDVSLREANSVRDGVYTIHGGHYIENGGKVYAVRREGQTWRLTRRGSPTYAPHVARHASGRWKYIGLDGGLEPMPFPWQWHADGTDLGRLTFHQRRIFEDTLIARTNIQEARHIVRRMGDDPVNHLTTRLSAEQQGHWRAAFEAARNAPRTRPRVARPAAAGGVAAGPGDWMPPATLDELLPAQWPETLWYYPPAHLALPERTAHHLILRQSRHNAAGAVGVGVLELGPRTPWAQLRAAPGGPTLAAGRFPAVFEWVSINLAALRTRVDAAGRPVFRVFRIRNGPSVNYLLRQAGAGGDASTTWLRQGEFDTGIRILTTAEHAGAP